MSALIHVCVSASLWASSALVLRSTFCEYSTEGSLIVRAQSVQRLQQVIELGRVILQPYESCKADHTVYIC